MRIWISWEEPVDETEDYRPFTVPVDPRILHWWCTGYGYGYSTICAVCEADSIASAKEAVRKHWKPQSWRFANKKEPGWMPPNDRFPVKDEASPG
jgi:hypothetical protein